MKVSLDPPDVAENRRPGEVPPKKILVDELDVVGLPRASSSVTVTALVAASEAEALNGADVITSAAPGPAVMVSLREPLELVYVDTGLRYDAVRASVPSARALVEQVAVPEARATPLHSTVAPSSKTTAPLGTPARLVTLAVSVTADPTTAGLADALRLVVVTAGVTLRVAGADVEPPKLPEAEVKTPDRASVPSVRALVEQVAVPATRVTEAQTTVEPTLKATVPLGMPPALVTTALSTTVEPSAVGFSELDTVVEVDAAPMLRVTLFDVELAKLADDEVKTAVRECLATARVETAQVAVPPDVATPLHSVVEPSTNLTVPSGVPAPDVVVDVSVATDPNVPGDGFATNVVVVAAAVMVSACEPEANPALEGGEVSDAVIVGVPASASP